MQLGLVVRWPKLLRGHYGSASHTSSRQPWATHSPLTTLDVHVLLATRIWRLYADHSRSETSSPRSHFTGIARLTVPNKRTAQHTDGKLSRPQPCLTGFTGESLCTFGDVRHSSPSSRLTSDPFSCASSMSHLDRFFDCSRCLA